MLISENIVAQLKHGEPITRAAELIAHFRGHLDSDIDTTSMHLNPNEVGNVRMLMSTPAAFYGGLENWACWITNQIKRARENKGLNDSDIYTITFDAEPIMPNPAYPSHTSISAWRSPAQYYAALGVVLGAINHACESVVGCGITVYGVASLPPSWTGGNNTAKRREWDEATEQSLPAILSGVIGAGCDTYIPKGMTDMVPMVSAMGAQSAATSVINPAAYRPFLSPDYNGQAKLGMVPTAHTARLIRSARVLGADMVYVWATVDSEARAEAVALHINEAAQIEAGMEMEVDEE